jgi:hypothetical protein
VRKIDMKLEKKRKETKENDERTRELDARGEKRRKGFGLGYDYCLWPWRTHGEIAINVAINIGMG